MNHLTFNSLAPEKNDSLLPETSFCPGIIVVCAYVYVCVSVRTITHDLFKLGSPNLDQRCNTPWLRSLLFGEAIDLDLQCQFKFKIKFYRILSMKLSSPESPNLDQRCKTTWLRSLLFSGGAIPRPLHGPNCFTVSTPCMYIDLGSQG